MSLPHGRCWIRIGRKIDSNRIAWRGHTLRFLNPASEALPQLAQNESDASGPEWGISPGGATATESAARFRRMLAER